MLITEAYRQQNEQLHSDIKMYGLGGVRWAKDLQVAIDALKAESVLDYGCGKGELVRHFKKQGYNAFGYDPAVAEFSARPEPADFVVCTDVLEHVEPQFVENVLKDIKALTKKTCFLVISTKPAKKNLPDGRNAHLSLYDSNVWLYWAIKHFSVVKFIDFGIGCVIVGVARP